jgi:two-component system sensor histidine kinase/response regulator
MNSLDVLVGPESGTRPQGRSADGRARVWVVDDTNAQREFCRAALASTYDVRVFAGGAAMLETLASSDAPDVLVVDLYMDDMTGLDVCRFIRNTEGLALCPIVILTATGARDDVLDALAAGANDFIRAPVSEQELNARVAGLLRTAELHNSLSSTERQLRVEAAFRERFMGMLAHDLRQPLQTIIMGCNLLAEMHAADGSTSIIARQLRAAQRMQRMVAELLDFTRNRPDSGMPVERRAMDLAEVSRVVMGEIRTAYPTREFTLRADEPCTGEWDPDRLSQVLSNLVGNAIEHGDPNCRVDVCLTNVGEAVELRVSNAGPPIPEDLLATSTDPSRSAQDPSRAQKGVRLGLHIVHQIVRAHGGTLTAQSSEGVSHFSIRLPRTSGPDPRA